VEHLLAKELEDDVLGKHAEPHALCPVVDSKDGHDVVMWPANI
jgi:hypothetical protein